MEIVTEVEVRDGPAPDESEVVTDVEVVVLHEQPALTLEPMLPPGVAPPAALCSAMSGPAGASTADQPQRHAAALMACPEELPVAAAPPGPPPMTAEEALRQAEAEGLTLLKSESSNTGYKGVGFIRGGGRSKPYRAEVWRGGKYANLGSFATAEEAALAYACTPEGRAAVAAAAAALSAPPPLTAEEALRQAEAEGLTLLKSASSSTDYKGVGFKSRPKATPYQAQVWRGGKHATLGSFATAEEAALVVARTPEGRAAAAAAAAAPPAPPPLTAEEALRQAEAEGLTLLRSESSRTGYKGVCFNSRRNITKPYEAQVWRGGKHATLGTFATAEEAALCYARAVRTAPRPKEGQAHAAAAAAAAAALPAKRTRRERDDDAAEPEADEVIEEPDCEVVIIDGIEVDADADA